MLTARDTLPDKLAGFEVGADDYLVKPFALPELLARLQALTRRHQAAPQRVLEFEGIELNLGTLIAKRDGVQLSLNPACLKLLEKLLLVAPQVVRRRDLEKLLWEHEPPDSDALRTHLYTLRRHLDKPFRFSLLQTVHGIGYRLGRVDDHSI
jgi:DNA-binding response OmpR family regulator